jgi:hypothetical protein
VFSLNSNDPSIALRQYKWDQAFRDLSGHPFGYGLGTAITGYSATLARGGAVLNVGIQSVDSGYLKIALEQGLAVMVLFIAGSLAMLGGLFRRSVRAATPVGAATAVGAAGALASFLVLLITGAFQDGLPALGLWIVVGLGLAEPLWHRESERDAPAAEG